MDMRFTPLTNAISYIPLDLIKSELRKVGVTEDSKIENLIEDSLSYFESITGFYARQGVIEIKFSYKDRSDYNQRTNISYADFYSSGSAYNYNYGEQFYKYETDIGGRFLSQIPTKLEFFSNQFLSSNNVTFEKLTADELETLPALFFQVTREKTLQFVIRPYGDNNVVPQALIDKRFSLSTIEPVTIEIENLNEITNQTLSLPDDIRRCILRMACMMYESPSWSSDLHKDVFIASVFRNYNCRVDI